jgi:polysaccharide deacetylase 2 family uncharacterized protein YibQ
VVAVIKSWLKRMRDAAGHALAGRFPGGGGPARWAAAGAALVVVLLTIGFGLGWLAAPPPPAPSAISGVAPPRPDGGGVKTDPAAAAVARPGLGLTVEASDPAAFAAIPPPARIEPLAETADPAFVEMREGIGPLPRIAADGRQPWQALARPFDRSDDRPRIVIIVAGLGLSAAATQAAIERLPGAMTLAFDPLAGDSAAAVARARRFGHETLTMLALESLDFPFDDQGPQAIRAADQPAVVRDRLERALTAVPASVGVLAVGGSAFAAEPAAARPLLADIKRLGLMLVDATAAGAAVLAGEAAELGLPRVSVDLVIDEPATRAAIDERLAALERLARERLVAVGLGRPLPVTVARLRAWADGLDGLGFVLVPATAAVGRQFRDR